MSQKTWAAAAVTFGLGVLSFGCQSGGIGDPCVPEDEYQQYFTGYSVTEVNMESRSFQCETRLCLVNHFQGRVSCPYGQTQKEADLGAMGTPSRQDFQNCHIPGTSTPKNQIRVEVNKQYEGRKAANTVYCSCRCNGSDPTAHYCKCPTGFQCTELLNTIAGLGGKELAGSYCIKEGTEFINGVSSTGVACQDDIPVKSINDAPGTCGTYDGH
jgi:hypothetical protein